MENKDNIFKLIARILFIGLIFYSLSLCWFQNEPTEGIYVVLYVLGVILSFLIGIALLFIIVGVSVFLITRFINWAFNTDFFD
jgi:hypothetical protein